MLAVWYMHLYPSKLGKIKIDPNSLQCWVYFSLTQKHFSASWTYKVNCNFTQRFKLGKCSTQNFFGKMDLYPEIFPQNWVHANILPIFFTFYPKFLAMLHTLCTKQFRKHFSHRFKCSLGALLYKSNKSDAPNFRQLNVSFWQGMA